MTLRRVIFLSDTDEAPDIDRDLLGQYRDEIERKILEDDEGDAEQVGIVRGSGLFLTSIPRPKIGRVLARWVKLSDEEALVTGVRSGQAYEAPPDDID